MDLTIGEFRGIVTGILLVSFLWLIAWAWSKARKAEFEAAAREPLEEDESP